MTWTVPLAFAFVTPLFAAAGLALASIPIIIHLLNRRRHKTVPWAAMTFLLAALKKNRKRLRFEQWLLLALRCCVLGLFGLALSRPMACDQSSVASLASTRNGLHVIVIDNSYSMAYEADRPGAKTHLDQAKIVAKQLIGRLSSGGESVALFTACHPAAAVIAEPTFDLEAARTAIDRIPQSFAGTDLAGALRLVRDLARAHPAAVNKSLDLLTDSTRSAWEGAQAAELVGLGKDLAASFRMAHYNIGRPSQNNAAILDVAPSAHLVRSQFDNAFTCLPRGFGTLPEAAISWSLDDQALPNGAAFTPALNSPTQTQAQVVFKNGGYHVISAKLHTDDRLPLDDTRWRSVEVASELKVLIVEGQRGVGLLAGSGAFLSLALAPPSEGGTHLIAGHEKTSSYIQPELISDLELSNKVLGDYRAIVLAGVAQVAAPQAEQLRSFVNSGGTLLLFMGEAVNGQAYNQTLLPRGLLPGPLVRRMSVSGDQKPFLFDFNPSTALHPLLNVFRNQEKTGLETAPVFTYWKVDLSDAAKAQRVLDYLPDEKGQRDPAITLQEVGAGRVVFVSTSANWDWTFLPAKPAFVALMHELLAGSISSGDDWLNKTVGDQLELPATLQLNGAPTLKDPQQLTVPLDAAANNAGAAVYRSRPLDRPGVYTLSTGKASFPVSVNVSAEEADIRTLDSPALSKALGGITLETFDDTAPAISSANAAGNDFGWSVMLIVLVGLGLECLFAMRFGHYRR